MSENSFSRYRNEYILERMTYVRQVAKRIACNIKNVFIDQENRLRFSEIPNPDSYRKFIKNNAQILQHYKDTYCAYLQDINEVISYINILGNELDKKFPHVYDDAGGVEIRKILLNSFFETFELDENLKNNGYDILISNTGLFVVKEPNVNEN